ncbi:MAG: hypothetical protein KJZ84_18090 [Bryobacteraceae bacterium]|nr:hypothetical protein [Bryobacteraceae bacterium]
MPRQITPATTIENLRKEAKRWLKALREHDASARERLVRAYPGAPEVPVLRSVQHALALEHGKRDWKALNEALAQGVSAARAPGEYERMAQDYVLAFDGDGEALRRLNEAYERALTVEDLRAEVWRRVYAFRQRSSHVPKNYLLVEEAQVVIAQDEGYGSWEALMKAAATGTPLPVAAFQVDKEGKKAAPARRMRAADWEAMIEVIREQDITAVEANGLMTDAVMEKIAGLDRVTRLSLGGSRELTDEGLRKLARMPQLEHLDVSGYPGGKVTDAGLEVLRCLPNLRTFEMAWGKGISDKGVRNLRYCELLERVNLMGSPTGDGAIEALEGKARVRHLSTGREVTDAGLRRLGGIPRFREAAEGGEPVGLLIDGPFTNEGLAGLRGLAGVNELDLFWHVKRMTAEGFAHLAEMANLMALGSDGELSSDRAMEHIARIPRLRRLRAQESVATEEGFCALSRSATLEGFWGRECANFGSRSFLAFARMPALRSLGVSLQKVEEQALGALAEFPALRELTPIGLTDEGFRHVGRCAELERLTCMYCRETTDAATEQIGGLRLSYYYAGLTRITDRSLEILGQMETLDQVDLYECKGVTDRGLAFLAKLPRLREVHLDSLPGVTPRGVRVFPRRVRVSYST